MIEFVAEFTTNHMGNLNVLLRMVEQAAKAGCSVIKMQKKNVGEFYSKEKLASKYNSPYGQTYEEYRTIFEFTDEDFDRFDAKCKECGVDWFATAQDYPSLEFLLKYDLPMYKVASSNSRNRELLCDFEKSIPKDKVIVVSVAGSTLHEIEETLKFFPNHKIYLLHCVAEYPCKDINLRLGNITVLKETFGSDAVRIGYSGHEEGIIPSIAAADLGVEMIERHFCLSRYSFVHHIECSLLPLEFARMVEVIHANNDLKKYYTDYLAPKAFSASFGMSEQEESFLVNQTYGMQYLHEKTEFHNVSDS